MKVAIVGGTGKEGRGLAQRWARAGLEVFVGSRDAARAEETAAAIAGAGRVRGGSNEWAVEQADLVVLSVPYSAHAATLAALAPRLAGKVLVDITVPLVPPKVTRVTLPAGQAAALEAQAIVGPGTSVVAAFHHVGAAHLADADHAVDCDVLVCSDDEAARARVVELVAALGMRGLEAGPLANAIALESLTPVLLFLNRKYKSAGAGLRITGLPSA